MGTKGKTKAILQASPETLWPGGGGRAAWRDDGEGGVKHTVERAEKRGGGAGTGGKVGGNVPVNKGDSSGLRALNEILTSRHGRP